MRSVMTKKQELLRVSDLVDYDVLTITETWLHAGHKNNEFISSKYRVFRKDRCDTNINAERGGGVLIAVRTDIDCEPFSIDCMVNLESICVKFPLNKGYLYIYCLYIQPTAKFEVYEAHCNAITVLKSQLSTDDMIIIVGDFNLPSVQWIENDDNFDFLPIIGESSSERAVIAKYVTSSLLQIGLFQLNNIVNVADHVLDLVFTDSLELVVVDLALSRLISSQASDKAHNPLQISIECEPKIYPNNSDSDDGVFCFRKANFDDLNEKILSYDFQMEFTDLGVDEMLQRFYEIMNNIFNECVPKSSLRKSNNPVWYSKQLCNLKNIRNREYRKLCTARKVNSNADDTKFITANDRFETKNQEEHERYIEDIGEKFKSDPKRFWSFVNSKRKSNNLPCKLMYNGKAATTNGDKANLLAEFLSSVYTAYPSNDSFTHTIETRDDRGFWNVKMSSEMVWCALFSLFNGFEQG